LRREERERGSEGWMDGRGTRGRRRKREEVVGSWQQESEGG
jgi:hypothetical protein